MTLPQTVNCAICKKEVMDKDTTINNKSMYLCSNHIKRFNEWLKNEELQLGPKRNRKWIPIWFSFLAFGILLGICGFIFPHYKFLFYNFMLLDLVFVYIGACLNRVIYPWLLTNLPYLKNYVILQLPDHELSRKDVLVIDATVIAGALVLLTMLNTNLDILPNLGKGLSCMMGISVGTLLGNITATIVIIFSISAITTCILYEKERGLRLMIAGFFYLFFAILAMTYVPDISELIPCVR